MLDDDLIPLVERVAATTSLPKDQARRVVLDVIAYLTESPEDFVMRRRRELKCREGLSNEAIFDRLAVELSERVFAPPRLSRRQIRRIIYG